MSKPVGPAVLEYLRKRAGEVVSAKEISEVTGFKNGQVRGAVAYMISNGLPIDKLQSGVWKYAGETSESSGRVTFRLVGETSDGTLVLEREDGALYMAKKV